MPAPPFPESSAPRLPVLPGEALPLGPRWSSDGKRLNFSLFSAHAEAVELLFFARPEDATPVARAELGCRTDGIWHGEIALSEFLQRKLPAPKPGSCYGYRLRGPYDPAGSGHRFNPRKVLLDPYAPAVARPAARGEELHDYAPTGEKGDWRPDERDNAARAPLGVLPDPKDRTLAKDKRPQIPWRDTVIYETHLKGLSMQHPAVPESERGTYLGAAHPAILEHLQRLGVTAIEFLPVHQHYPEAHLQGLGLPNYWGYSTLGFFAPDQRFAAAAKPGRPDRAIYQFREMVRRYHAAGIEVILDVVYNHTCEGGPRGPSLSFRGIDNASYYLLDPKHRAHCIDYTGTGNTLNAGNPRVLQMILDSLRYWVTEMGVDGFRFDLAATLTRGARPGDTSGFVEACLQDPILAQTKLIAEPWDLGPDGYRAGRFAPPFAQWNDRFRDASRSFFRGDSNATPDLTTRLLGSSDMFRPGGHEPRAAINFVTAHDGFTLRDLVSYDHKHNEANGEGNRDGSDHNLSWNYGVEGETDDPRVRILRLRDRKNLLATLLLAQGTPMLLGGDELGRTQRGNNNAYCQDNELSWFAWNDDPESKSLTEWVARLTGFRRNHAVLRRRSFFRGLPDADGRKDVYWFHPRGRELNDRDWNDRRLLSFGMLIPGASRDDFPCDGPDAPGGGSVLVVFNAYRRSLPFRFPLIDGELRWTPVLDSGRETPLADEIEKPDEGVAPASEASEYRAGDLFRIRRHSVALFACPF